MPGKVRVGIVGLGAQGSMYASLIADERVPRMAIGAICDASPAKMLVVTSK